MGAEREDTDPSPKRVGTEPGLGKPSGGSPAAAVVAVEQDSPPPVDFDALHAALGDPVDYEELSSGPAIEKGNESDDLLDDLEAAHEHAGGKNGARVGESAGQSSATYSSARPRTIPPTRAPVEDPNAPAVIVATDTDTVPSAPPQMTVPLGAVPASPFVAAPPGSNPHVPASHSPSGPHGVAPGHPSSGPHAASHPFTPQPFSAPGRNAPQLTMRMPERPVNPRRGKTPTVVMRPRGPSAKQKLVAFMAMLLLVTACGIAVIIWRKPGLVGLDPLGSPTTSASASAAPVGGHAAGPASGALGALGATAVAPPVTATASAAATASSAAPPPIVSAKKPLKPLAPPHPAASVPR